MVLYYFFQILEKVHLLHMYELVAKKLSAVILPLYCDIVNENSATQNNNRIEYFVKDILPSAVTKIDSKDVS